jgi:hypothetical protein
MGDFRAPPLGRIPRSTARSNAAWVRPPTEAGSLSHVAADDLQHEEPHATNKRKAAQSGEAD